MTIEKIERQTLFVQKLKEGKDEEIADDLLREFGGRQVMTANHHGVEIKTVRVAP